MNQTRWFKIVIYVMLIAMLASTVLMSIGSFLD
ncbi:stressosome-associated protein Prli42 [Cohnella nanjingensis]|uniref:Stressosome-associated protein Prli42 n=1 Tax=Cohnella nanjingensis TaxID=1387779 RepID=A0A7X0S104_9BACL|nr:stressosome-associated protein Prli42 [Cohnella nanjingensis]